MFLRERDPVRPRIEQVNRDAPVRSHSLNGPLQSVPNTEITADSPGPCIGRVVQDRRRRRDNHVVQVAQDRNECIGKPERKCSTVFHIAEKYERQNGDGRELFRALGARRDSPGDRRRSERFDYRSGRWVPLR